MTALVSLGPGLTAASALAWCAPLVLLVLPIWRLVRRKRRYMDPLWALLLLGVVNRMVSDFAHVPPELQHLSAILIAVLLAAMIRSYQRGDR